MARDDHILAVLWRRRLSVAVAFVVAFAAAAAITFSLPKVYSATAYVLVSPGSEAGSDFEATQISQVLTATYAELLQTPAVADVVAEELPSGPSGQALLDAVEVTPVTNSQLLEITAEGNSPSEARDTANIYAEVFVERQESIGPGDRSAVSLAEEATAPDAPSRPQPLLYLALGAVVAAFLAAAAGVLRHRFDQRLDVNASTREVLGVPVIGHIPRTSASALRDFLAGREGTDRTDTLAESFRLLLVNLSFVSPEERARTVAVVSSTGGEGKSTCVAGLGSTAAEGGLEVLLIDADLRRAGLSAASGLAPATARRGLSNLLVEPDRVEEVATRPSGAPYAVLPTGPIPPNPSALLSLPSLEEIGRQAVTSYDFVVYDSPPLSVGADASLIASKVEAVILVVDARTSRRSALAQTLDQLSRAGANVLGVVVNRTGRSVDPYYYDGDGTVAGNGRRGDPLGLGHAPRSPGASR